MFENDNIKHITIDGINYLQFKKLLEYNINHCFVLNDLNFSFRSQDLKNNINSFKTVCNHFNFKMDKICRPIQTHSNNIKILENITGINNVEFQDTDGLITDKIGIPLAITTADCIPIIIFDKKNRIIANIHSGWRGTLNLIVVNAFNLFINEFKSNPLDLLFFFGPAICQNCFEVEEDVKSLFYEKFNYLNNIDDIIKKGNNKDKYYIDIILLNTTILNNLGVPNNNIYLSNICTYCNSKYIHSYRARGKNEFGLGITIVSL